MRRPTKTGYVALHVSAWVEIQISQCLRNLLTGRAPRERVSWNVLKIYDDKGQNVSRSTWARELKCRFIPVAVGVICRAPRERVSWNYTRQFLLCITTKSRSTWARELKWFYGTITHAFIASRSTWARELKSISAVNLTMNLSGRAPRERVSWNLNHRIIHMKLTPSRSTWARELKYFQKIMFFYQDVALHVSAWVEISLPII